MSRSHAEWLEASRTFAQIAYSIPCGHCGHTYRDDGHSMAHAQRCGYPRWKDPRDELVKNCRCRQFVDPAETLLDRPTVDEATSGAGLTSDQE